MSVAALETRLIPRTQLMLSETESQVERRAHFDKKRIKELAESLEANGMVNPILVRFSARHDSFEIVAGERRFMAAGLAEWPDVPCSVRELTDQQVIEVQLTENLDREELHELAEAEGYEALVGHGMNAEQIAAKFGRSPTYVLRRLRLKTLSKACRRAFYDGKMGFTQALEIAKLPVHEHQDKLLADLLDVDVEFDAPLSAERLRQAIEEDYLSSLEPAPFPTGDPTLNPVIGACNGCPNRTGAQKALFDQTKGLGNCLDLKCFNGKKLAHSTRELEDAKARGVKVITGAAAKKIAPHGRHNLVGFVDLADQPHQDPKRRSFKQLLGKDYQAQLLQMPTGEVIHVAPEADARKVLPKAKADKREDNYQAQQRAAEKKRRAELDYRAELLRRVAERLVAAGDVDNDLRLACQAMADRLHHDGKVRLFKVMGWAIVEKKDKYRGMVREYPIEKIVAAAANETELWQLLRILSVAGDLEVYSHANFTRVDRLHKLAARVGVKPEKVQAELKAAADAKKKPKQKAKAVRK